jgi:hypothetical protein
MDIETEIQTAGVAATAQPEQTNQPNFAEPQTPTDAASVAAATVGRRGRKPGRHKRDCQCPKCQAKKDGSTPDPTSVEPDPVKPVEIVTDQDREICRQTIKAVTQTVDCISAIGVDKKCKKSQINSRKTQEFVALSQFKPEVREGIVLTGTVVAEKHGCIKVLPEISLLGFIVAHVLCMVKLFNDIESLAPPIDVESTITPEPNKDAPGAQKQP